MPTCARCCWSRSSASACCPAPLRRGRPRLPPHPLPSQQTRYDIADEFTTALKYFWCTDGKVDFEGTYFQAYGAQINPRPISSPRPILMSAASSDVGLEYACKHCDALFITAKDSTVAGYEKRAAKIHDGAARYGRQVRVCVMCYVVMEDTDEKAMETVKWIQDEIDRLAMEILPVAPRRTMEYLEGYSLTAYLRLLENNDEAALEELTRIGFDPGVFCNNVITNFLRDAFRFGVFHADLHPANLLILPNNVVGYVDFGIVAKLTQEARHKQIELTLAYSAGDPDAIYRQFLNICTLTPEADLEKMRRQIAQMARTWYVEPAVHGKARFRVSVTITMMDLLTAARHSGALVDGEMVKYIRSTVLVDGVVSRLAPDLDLAGALRTVVEEYLFEQSRKKVLSSGGLITMLADLAVWMKNGPSSMVRAVELLERRQVNLKTFSRPAPERDRPLRAKLVAGASVWALALVYLALGGAAEPMRESAFWTVMVRVFVTSWTVWLLLLLRRLTLAG